MPSSTSISDVASSTALLTRHGAWSLASCAPTTLNKG